MPRAKRKKKSQHRVARFVGRFFAVLGTTLLSILLLLVASSYMLCNGPSVTARNMFTTTMLETGALKFVPSLFLSKEEIADIVNSNSVYQPDTTTDADVPFEDRNEEVPLDSIELLDVVGDTFVGKMMIVHDPSRVSIATVPKFSPEVNGMTVKMFARREKAIGVINAGGFVSRTSTGSGAVPEGIVIKNGKLVFGEPNQVTSLVAFDSNHRLIVGKMTATEALAKNIQEAVSFGPAFIINGEAMEVSGTSGGINPRTVIGQRADGAMLLLVIDGRQAHSLGATYKDCIDVMLEYGAVNAGNLDGGSSTAMIYNGDLVNSCVSLSGLCYLPNAIVVK